MGLLEALEVKRVMVVALCRWWSYVRLPKPVKVCCVRMSGVASLEQVSGWGPSFRPLTNYLLPCR